MPTLILSRASTILAGTLLAALTSSNLLADDYIAIRVDAENFTAKSDSWYLTSPDSIPDIQPDPDGEHTTGASNSAYMELLPDTRVTSLDQLISGTNYWGGPGGGPFLEYYVDVPEPGTYTVWVKMYATGTEDNGIHVGINDTKPLSGHKIQLCGGKNRWSWTSNQRTNDNHCGVTQTITIDVPNAGPNTVTFYAREDGFEIDQFILLKETNPTIEDCYPLLSDKIRCANVQSGATIDDTVLPLSITIDGNTETTDPNTPATEPPTPEHEPQVLADLSLTMGENLSVESGESFSVIVTVENTDVNTASNTEVMLDVPNTLNFMSGNNCFDNNNTVTCDFGIIPAGDTDSKILSFISNAVGSHRVDGKVSSDITDPVSDNNEDSLQITVIEAATAFDAEVLASISSNIFSAQDSATIKLVINSIGTDAYPESQLVIKYGDGLTIDIPELLCTETALELLCTLDEISQGGSSTVTATVSSQTEGDYSIETLVQSSNEEDNSNNTAVTAVTVINAPTSASSNGIITIEAEQFYAQSESQQHGAPAWFKISNASVNTPQPDPDSASAANVSGNAYMELLPDIRLAENDAPVQGVTNSNTPENAATLQYQTFFTEANRYYIHALIRANGTQDNSLHVGANNSWPDNSRDVSLCNPDGNWQWASARETNGVCDTDNRPYLDVPTPGLYTIAVAQNDDGLELDRILLTSDVLYQPVGLSDVPSTYNNPDVDLQIAFTPTQQKAIVTEQSKLSLAISNNNATHIATGITVTLNGLGALLDTGVQSEQTCERSAQLLICSIDSIAPQATHVIDLNFIPAEIADYNITASTESAQNDSLLANNTTSSVITASAKGGNSGGGSMSLLEVLLFLIAAFFTLLSHQAKCNEHARLALAIQRESN